MVDDMHKPVIAVTVALIIGLFFFGVMVGEAKEDRYCEFQGVELTDLLLEAYQVYESNPTRWEEIRREMWQAVGAPVKFVGVFVDGERWHVVSQRSKGFYIQSGWGGVGDDGQFHSPTCAVVVSELPNQFR